MSDPLNRAVVFAADFRQRVTDINVLSDSNMEAVGTGNWVAYSGATLSKESPGYSGNQCLRATTSTTNQGAYQEVLVNAQPVRITGWCRGTVSQRVLAGGAGAPAMWDFPISSNWQRIDVSGTTNGTRLYLVAAQNGAGYVEFDDIQVIQARTVIPNLGKAGGAPAFLTCGDGSTTTTFPSPLAGFGATFDGGDYINTGIVDRYEWSDQFSLYILGRVKSGDVMLLSAYNGNASVQTGIYLRNTTTNRLALCSNANSDIAYTSSILNNTIETIVWNWLGTTSSTGCSFYKNTKSVSISSLSDARNGSVKSGKPFLIGASWDNTSIVQPITGTIYAAGVFDGLLSPRDINILDKLVKSGIR